MDLVEGFETGPAFSQPSPARSCTFSRDPEALFAVSFAPSEVLMLSSSEEVDVFSIEPGEIEESPPRDLHSFRTRRNRVLVILVIRCNLVILLCRLSMPTKKNMNVARGRREHTFLRESLWRLALEPWPS